MSSMKVVLAVLMVALCQLGLGLAENSGSLVLEQENVRNVLRSSRRLAAAAARSLSEAEAEGEVTTQGDPHGDHAHGGEDVLGKPEGEPEGEVEGEVEGEAEAPADVGDLPGLPDVEDEAGGLGTADDPGTLTTDDSSTREISGAVSQSTLQVALGLVVVAMMVC